MGISSKHCHSFLPYHSFHPTHHERQACISSLVRLASNNSYMEMAEVPWQAFVHMA